MGWILAGLWLLSVGSAFAAGYFAGVIRERGRHNGNGNGEGGREPARRIA